MVLDTFKIKHDTVDPVGFTVKAQGKRVVIATDLGEVSERIEQLLLAANLFFLESNYDVDVLGANEYECWHKDRVIENHLSNDKTAQVVAKMRPGARAVLGHISERSNSAELVQALHADNKQVTVLRSGACSELFYV
jgi:phosphoribosyl 1,2-cyclic phosphodiesterase